MDLFNNDVANGTFGTLAFGVLTVVLIVAGFNYKVLKRKKTVVLVAIALLAVTVNSAGLFGEIAGALRGGMNTAGEKAASGLAGAEVADNPPTTKVTPVTAGGALVGLAILVWYGVKIYAAKGKPKDWKEMAGGALIGVCAGTGVGFLGIAVSSAVIVSNNVGFWLVGG
ncbi:hypothetical protein [Streptomyces albipurpureus]|uniref:Integral membrane protein n=1 Tax=Streptomyces albipurpureus TaxID=2897419 RepID=A0ABT0V4C1_9ACTN|nr:hypothetical protein [Streptomyces sp. CWNU-1]MCM2394388.1 hypothetical protein [Streptomyces sp. CWNU-1]